MSPKHYIVMLICLGAIAAGLLAAIIALSVGALGAFGVVSTGFAAAATFIVVATAVWQVSK